MFAPSVFSSLKMCFVFSTFARTLVQPMYTRGESALFVKSYHIFARRNEGYILTANKKRCFE